MVKARLEICMSVGIFYSFNFIIHNFMIYKINISWFFFCIPIVAYQLIHTLRSENHASGDEE